jgi:membrane protein YqaA with SNARE-associated domain
VTRRWWRAPTVAVWQAIERFAHARGALPATFLWNLAQGSVVPGPVELMFAPLAIAEPKRAWSLASAATIGSVLGGCVAYWIGVTAFATVGAKLLALLGVSDAQITESIALMSKHGWWFILGSTLTPISTKVVAIGAGAAGVPLPVFVLSLAAGRVARFALGAVLVQGGRGLIERWRGRVLRR